MTQQSNITVYKTFRSNRFSLDEIKAKCEPVQMTASQYDELLQNNSDEDVNYIAVDADGNEIEY